MEKKVNSSVLYSIQVHRIQVHLAFQCFPSLSLLTAGSFPPRSHLIPRPVNEDIRQHATAEAAEFISAQHTIPAAE